MELEIIEEDDQIKVVDKEYGVLGIFGSHLAMQEAEAWIACGNAEFHYNHIKDWYAEHPEVPIPTPGSK